MNATYKYAFIVGAPRSGTTILNEVLGRHPDIVSWYEPYFIWDYYIGNKNSDVRTVNHLTEKQKQFIQREFSLYLHKAKTKILIEKTPENCLKIPFIHSIFPDAKWIHILRDGRAVTYSIHKEWLKRKEVVENFNIRRFLAIFFEMMKLQPFWRNRFQALWFEIKSVPSLDCRKYFKKSKWHGEVGWGPRFSGWQDIIKHHSVLQFNAMQWLKCVEVAIENANLIERKNWLQIRYEDLVKEPHRIFKRIFKFLHLPRCNSSIWQDIHAESLDKWNLKFQKNQIDSILPILEPMLIKLNYME